MQGTRQILKSMNFRWLIFWIAPEGFARGLATPNCAACFGIRFDLHWAPPSLKDYIGSTAMLG